MAKKKSKKQESDNPIIALADKVIPPSYNRKLEKWIKAHTRQIALSLKLVTTLYSMYLWRKAGVRKIEEMQIQIVKEKLADLDIASSNHLVSSNEINRLANSVFDDHKQFARALQKSEQNVAIAQRVLTSDEFKAYLKAQGYTNIRRPKK